MGLSMKSALKASVAIALFSLPALAAEAPKPPAPPPVRPYACRDPHLSADFVPGIDAQGRPVAPADLPGGVDVEISTDVLAFARTRNRQLDGAGVEIGRAHV